MLQIDNRAWLVWAAWMLIFPGNWLISALTAAIIHELFHIAAILLLGGKIRCIITGPIGSVIEVQDLTSFQEAICAVTGPLGSFLLVLWIRRFPILGICALVQGLFNCLPVYPLDGGRFLRCVLEQVIPTYAYQIAISVEVLTFLLLLCGSILLTARYSWGPAPIALTTLLTAHAILRKRP